MTIKTEPMSRGKLQINLSKPEGNANYLLSIASNIGKQLQMEPHVIDAIIEDMKSLDYQHLVSVLDKNFGDYIDIYPS